MKRNTVVLALVVVVLAVMVWSGVDNYRRRKAEQQKLQQMQAVLTPATPAAASGDADAAPFPEEKLEIEGKQAPAFTLQDLQGKRVSLASYKGKAVLVNFMATWCAPCKVETPWLIDLRHQYGPQGFEILGVSTDDLDKDDKKMNAQDKAEIAKFITNMHIDYPVLIDGDSIGKAYGGKDGIDALPTSFFVDRGGKVIEATIGLHERADIEAAIKKALSSGGA